MPKRTASKRLLREPQVQEKTGLSRVTLWRLERADKFPRRIQLTDSAVAWLESDIDAWIDQKVNDSKVEAVG